MSDPSKRTDWLGRVPGWLKAIWASVAAVAAAIIAFQDNWRYYLIAAVIVIPLYLVAASVYILFARRKTRSKKTPWAYRYGNKRFLGLIGLGLVCLFLMLPFVSPAVRFAGRDLFLGTPVPSATPIPPQLQSPDVLIAPFNAPASSSFQVEQWLQESLEEKLGEYRLDNVTVHVGETPIRSEVAAQAAANESGSKVVIWGWYDELGIQVKIFLSGGDEAGTLLQGTKVIPLASSGGPESDLAVVIRETLPQNVTFLSLYVVGHLEYLSNNYQAGQRAFDAAMAQIPAPEKVEIKNQAILHFFRARQMDRSGIDPDEVVCEYVRAIELDPQFGVAYNNLGLVVSKMHVARTPLSPEARACLERVGISIEYADLPTRLFERAVLASPNLTLARYNQFAFLWLQGSTDHTLIRSELESIQAQDPGLVGTYIILGAMKDREGDPAGAIQMYRSGIAVEPGIPLLHTNLGQLLYSHEKDETRAESEFREALRLDPNNLEARLALGHLYYRQGRLAEAAPLLDQIVLAETTGYFPLLVQRDAYILRSTISFTEGQRRRALDDIKLALTKPFGDAFLPFLLGLLYQQDGQNDLAAENFSEAADREGSPIHNRVVWNLFKERCFTEESASMPFADWALTRLPSSTCLPLDPRERILAAYGLLNEQLFALREAPQLIILGAQCPFVYTQDPLTGEWQFDTTILYNIVDREAAQVRPLTRFNGSLLIREEEPEISYLNRIRVIAEMADGSFQTLTPDVQELQQADADYKILQPGEELLVSFDAHSVRGEVRQWWVEAVGYYSPLP